ncbi:MAG: AAA family ATPase [Myxococcales bacterium]|nr:AAA family ATPase [Myxococcales bacterium]MCB9731482.1 AAA family ATPase [Deltaproteobacteria bacterium]
MSGKVSSKLELEYLIRARYALIYVVSAEEERVERAIRKIGEDRDRKVMAWSITQGFQSLDGGSSYSDIKDPLRALDFIQNFEDNVICVLRDYHPFLKDPSIVRKMRDMARILKESDYYQHLIMLSPTYSAPLELEKEVAVVDFDLPSRDELEDIVWEVAQSVPDSVELSVRKDAELREAVVESALGLTADEARSVFAKSLVKTRDFDIDTILAEKKGVIRKSGILEFYQTDNRFSDVGGLEILKAWLNKRKAAFSREARDFGLPAPKGILLIGVPGCGKSLTAKAIGAMWHMPLLRLDVGKVFGSLVGSSEENMRKAIKTAEAVAPSILWLDELEKGFSGSSSSGQTDGGTTARVFGTFITWLQEKQSSVFVIATANDVKSLPPELLRKGRFDEIFFVDLPSPKERLDIFKIHVEKRGRDPQAYDYDALVAASQQFSGSEIEQAVVSALYDCYEDDKADLTTDRLVKSTEEIIPLAYTMKEGIDGMREWSKSRARRASLVDADGREEGGGGRKLEI